MNLLRALRSAWNRGVRCEPDDKTREWVERRIVDISTATASWFCKRIGNGSLLALSGDEVSALVRVLKLRNRKDVSGLLALSGVGSSLAVCDSSCANEQRNRLHKVQTELSFLILSTRLPNEASQKQREMRAAQGHLWELRKTTAEWLKERLGERQSLMVSRAEVAVLTNLLSARLRRRRRGRPPLVECLGKRVEITRAALKVPSTEPLPRTRNPKLEEQLADKFHRDESTIRRDIKRGLGEARELEELERLWAEVHRAKL